MPKHVKEFLCLRRRKRVYYLDGIHKLTDIVCGKAQFNPRDRVATVNFTVERKTPRDPLAIKRELMK